MKKLTLLLIGFLFSSTVFAVPYFQKITTGPLVTTSNHNNVIAWGDYDNDGDQDIVITAINDDCVTCQIPLLFFRNDGNGIFTRLTDNRIAQTSYVGSGLAWGDYDNDGWLDLFICGTINSRNKLFHNDQNGNFTEVLTGTIVEELNSSQTCAWTDYDKDGWLDLFVTNRYGTFSNRLYKNNGNSTFTKILSGSIVNDIAESRGCAWGDYDNDGWPDLFVTNYAGENDFLYHNNHDGTFTRIFDGPMVNDGLWGACPEWIDYDNNGWLDLYVTNGNGNNRLYYNHGQGNFTLSNSLPSQDRNSGGFTWGDYDNDGLTDLFTCGRTQNNVLYKNNGSSLFTRETNEIVSQEGSYSVSSSFADYDLDGKLDLVVANRYNHPYNYLYKNVGTTGNYITLKLSGCTSNRAGIGSRITVVTGDLRQYKDISSGSAWDSENSLWPHFGIGNYQMVDTVIVMWPSTVVTKYTNVNAGKIVEIDECRGIVDVNENTSGSNDFNLFQNYPNPFNPVTQINFDISKSSFVNLSIFDINGKKVQTLVNEFKNAGNYQIEFNSNGELSSGIYFYRITSGNYTSVKKMTLLK